MKKVKEDIWDEISEIENGGQEGYYGDDWEDLLDSEKAERVHRDAQDLGMTDLDYVNREEKLEKIEDDFAYEIESDDSISITDFNESPLRSFTDVFEEFLNEMEQEGEVHTGYYFHECRDVNDLCNEILQMQLDGFEETYGVGFDLVKKGVVNAWVVLSDALNVLSKYVTKDYPKCNACFEMLVRLAKEYNETLKEFNITEWPKMVTIPSVGGSLNEAKVHQFGDYFIQIGRALKNGFGDLIGKNKELEGFNSINRIAEDIFYILSNKGFFDDDTIWYEDGLLYTNKGGKNQRLVDYLIEVVAPDFLKQIDKRYRKDYKEDSFITPQVYLKEVMKLLEVTAKQRFVKDMRKKKYEGTKRGSKKNLTEGTQLFYVFIKFQNGTTSNEVIEFSHAMEELYPEADWANPTRDTIVAQNVNMEVAEDILEDAFEIPSYRNYLTTPQAVTIEK